MKLGTLINELKEAWENGDDSIYDLDNLDDMIANGLSDIDDYELREQVIQYFGEEISSG